MPVQPLIQLPRHVFESTILLDCDDMDVNINPDASEVCDGVDNNCNGTIDDGVTTTFFADVDGDGYGDSTILVEACFDDANLSTNGDDCDDSNGSINPVNTDIVGDNIDQDDGIDGTDFDGDGDPSIVSGNDCDDSDATVENLDVDLDGTPAVMETVMTTIH